MPGWLWFLAGLALGGFATGFLFVVAISEGWKELFNR
jgi:hypothetical protein